MCGSKIHKCGKNQNSKDMVFGETTVGMGMKVP
jgi:hypothetical protein